MARQAQHGFLLILIPLPRCHDNVPEIPASAETVPLQFIVSVVLFGANRYELNRAQAHRKHQGMNNTSQNVPFTEGH